jgi:hypothetical protein
LKAHAVDEELDNRYQQIQEDHCRGMTCQEKESGKSSELLFGFTWTSNTMEKLILLLQ